MLYDPIKETKSKLKEYHVDRVILSVDQWSKYKDKVQLSWNTVKFNSSEAKNVPNNQQGVYSFVVKPGIANHSEYALLLYVGKTKRTFYKRFMEYLREPNKTKPRIKILEMIELWGDNNLWFSYAEIDDKKLIDETEEQLLMAYIPPMNSRFPAEIRRAIKAW